MNKSWERKKLKDVCKVINGRAYKQSELLNDGKYPVLRVGNFFTNRHWYYSNLELDENKYCTNGDLLYAWSASFGPRIWQGDKVIYHYHIWKMVPDLEAVIKQYLFWYLEWITENLRMNQGVGTTMIHVTKNSIENELIPLPPLPIQKQIVQILDESFAAIDKAKANIQKNIQNAEELLQAKSMELFSEALEKYPEKSIDELCKVERGSSPRPIQKYITNEEDGVNWIKIGDVSDMDKYVISTRQKITKEGAKKSRFVDVGDFILSNSMSYGRPYIMKIQGYIHDGWFVLRLPESLDSEYFWHILASPYLREQFENLAAGAIVKNISSDLVKKATIPLPPVEEQKNIVITIEKIKKQVDNLIQVYEMKMKGLDELKKSLLQKAFSGELTKEVNAA